MLPTELCWQTGDYTDECICDFCDHSYECSASNNNVDDDEFDDIEELVDEEETIAQ